MPRKKITNINQKKAEQKLKRAAKRGDIAPLEPKPPKLRHPESRRIPTEARPDVDAARKLQSAFVKLPRQYLDQTKLIASQLTLPRPIPGEVAVFPSNPPRDDGGSDSSINFSCPKRPKWRFDMSKAEVEANEEGLFKKWLDATDRLVEEWRDEKPPTTDQPEGDPEIEKPEPLTAEMPRSWCYFERNTEVWRQLWRVTEISQIILVLLDSRCPLLHYPPSLGAYLATHKVILVLTKVDLSGPERTQAWTTYLQSAFPGVRVTHVESYIEKKSQHAEQGRKHYEPYIPTEFRRKLVEAIRDLHSEMLEPPAKVKQNEAWLKKWTPPVKRNIDWDAVLSAQGGRVGSEVGGAAIPLPTQEVSAHGEGEGGEHREHVEPEFLTVGVIGQPNVGKSSLLNALFGVNRVRTSKQPGKTKHYQTLFWTSEVRLVDCPGLVMPNNIPMEMQVLSGVLPISRVSAIPACIYFASQHLPLEKIYKLSHPTPPPPPAEDKRTWREGSGPHPGPNGKAIEWTALDILTAYADSKGWVTAKAGRPDMNRAGNEILRSLVEGRVAWAFWPPGTDIAVVGDNNGNGIWLQELDQLDADFDDHEEDSAEEEVGEGEGSDTNSEEQDMISEDEAVGGRFDALSLDEASDEEEGSDGP